MTDQRQSNIQHLVEVYGCSVEKATEAYDIALKSAVSVEKYYPNATMERQVELQHNFAYWNSSFIIDREKRMGLK